MKDLMVSEGKVGPVFVVGYSRSGTKFICNLLEQASHGEIEHLGELHFFGRLSTTTHEPVTAAEVRPLLKKLAEQYARRKGCPYASVEKILALFPGAVNDANLQTRLDVYRYFLTMVAQDRKVNLLCDGTPRNAYYIAEILDAFPSARIIYMVRDPRDSILSQKRKSKQLRERGEPRESFRLALNYNPVLMARFWESSIRYLEQHEGDPRILSVRYEDMLDEPDTMLRRISEFVGCEGMEKFSGLVAKGNSGKYRRGLTLGEISAIEATLGGHLERYSYERNVASWVGFLFVPMWVFRFVVTAPFVYLLNLGRFSTIFHEIRKRILR